MSKFLGGFPRSILASASVRRFCPHSKAKELLKAI